MFDEQITDYLKTLNSPSTFQSYSRALISFHHWYTTTYDEEASALLLTSDEVRKWRTYLSIACQLSAATVNLHLSAIRSLVRHYGGSLQVKGIRQMMTLISPLNGRELGRLLAATDGDSWFCQRNRAMLELMARTGLRVSEMLAFRALRGGVDLATLSRLLGHETLATTARYLHPDKESVAAMVEEL